ncbi:type IV toxin-antitoxin system AbiEi family antitoxin domain-containing protein [Microbacterium hydrocarbonoxydans]|nr:type IV toxin-antitoxin system AbiEi family antitoxin domain-containing protein [Microbacterium hydrocarbonoxydans]
MEQTPRQRSAKVFTHVVFSRDDLLQTGLSGRQITSAVRSGRLTRLRRDRYVRGDAGDDVMLAAQIGGRVTCLSLLRMLGIFVLEVERLHVHVPRNGSRFTGHRKGRARVHWGEASDSAFRHVTTLAEAISHSVRCQDARAALATLDSLMHHQLVTRDELTAIFRLLPARFGVLLRLVDPSAASGPETFMRLILRTLGVQYETQVWIPHVGYVDFVVEGWLIIECDSKEFHEGWEKQKEDRARDIAAARVGYVTVRPLASDILHATSDTQTAIGQMIEALRPRVGAPRRS